MKKILFILISLIAFSCTGQVIVHNQPVKLKSVALGVQTDSLLVIQDDGLINYLPITDIQISPEVAIISKDEGNGETFYPQNFSRDFKGVGGAGALDMSFADGLGSYGSLNGGIGSQTLVLGYNVKSEGYGAFLLGQDSDIPSSGTYAFNVGTDNSIGGYSGVGIGTFLNNTTNYGIQIGHSIDFTSGGLNVGVGFALSETTALSDKVALFGQANKEPINSEGFASNNIGAIFGSGDITGDGSTKFVRVTPRNSIVLFRDALAGLVNLEESTLANLQTWDDTFPHAAATVEYVQDAVSNAGGIGGTISVGEIAIGNVTANTIVGSPLLTFNAGTLSVLGGASFLAQVQADGFVIPAGTSDDVLLGDGTTTSLAGIGGGSIGGSIADNQIAVGNGADAIDGSSALTFDGTLLGMPIANAIRFGSQAQIDYSGGLRMVTLATGTNLEMVTGLNGDINLTSGDNVAISSTNGTTIEGLTYPSADGTNGQVVTTDGSGNLTFSTPAGGGIGGSIADNQVAFGVGTDIGGEAGFTWNGTTLDIETTAPQLFLDSDNGGGTITMLETGDFDMKFELLGSADYSFFSGGQEQFNIGNGVVTSLEEFSVNQNISMNSTASKIGWNVQTLGSSSAYNEYTSSVVRSVAHDTQTSFLTKDFSYSTSIGMQFSFYEQGTYTESFSMNYGGSIYGDTFHWVNLSAMDFNGTNITGSNYTMTSTAASFTISSWGEVIKMTNGGAATLTISDTATQNNGANVTIMAYGSSDVTIATTGTATINGSSTLTLTIAGFVAGSPINSIQLIQDGDNTDDWLAIGAYTVNP